VSLGRGVAVRREAPELIELDYIRQAASCYIVKMRGMTRENEYVLESTWFFLP